MSMYIKLAAIAMVFLGETLSIGAELIASKKVAAHSGDYVHIFLLVLIPIVIGGALLVAGYMLGYLYLKNIWIIAAISVGSILIVEPILALVLFRQLPTTGAAIGFIFGVLGTLSALFI